MPQAVLTWLIAIALVLALHAQSLVELRILRKSEARAGAQSEWTPRSLTHSVQDEDADIVLLGPVSSSTASSLQQRGAGPSG